VAFGGIFYVIAVVVIDTVFAVDTAGKEVSPRHEQK